MCGRSSAGAAPVQKWGRRVVIERVRDWVCGRPVRQRIYAWSAVAVGIVLLSPFRFGVVVGESMTPTLQPWQWYVLERAQYRRQPVQRGDVIVFERAGLTYVKRVLALEGDTVFLLKTQGSDEDTLLFEWQLERLQELVRRRPFRNTMKLVRRRVPAGFCYVVGDHLDGSFDSRAFGPVLLEHVKGKVVGTPPVSPAVQELAVRLGSDHRS